MKRILITGASGFIGEALAVEGVSRGHSVFAIGAEPDGNACVIDGAAETVALRLPSTEIAPLLAAWRPDVLFHCAGSAFPAQSVNDPSRDFQSSVPVLHNLLEAVRTHAPNAHLIYLSSAAVYGKPYILPTPESLEPAPLSPYGFHKWLGEILCREYSDVYGIKTSVARIFSAFGPGLERQIIWDAIGKFRREKSPVFFGTGMESRDFIYIDDLVRALFRMAELESSSHSVINVASGEGNRISEVIAMVAERMGVKDGSWSFSGIESPGIPPAMIADITKLCMIGSRPECSFLEGIERTVDWALRKGA
ncbi:MAG: NAD(P)-dependent oxidoreductase [Verrucomicrobiae bacterium]|nr:NAD(P)-dependent oxidoreductase [Verrucomicrobiae bacterium]